MKLQDIYNILVESKIGSFSGAGVIFFDGKCILMLENFNKRWALPGGKPYPDESPLDTARRECIEEVGSCPGNLIDNIRFVNRGRVFYSYISIVKEQFDVTLSEEHKNYKWVELNNIKKLNLNKNIQKNLNKIIESLQKINLE